MKTKLIILIIGIFAMMSCEKVILGDDIKNGPFSNFDLFWTDIDEHSSMIYAKDVDWDAVYDQYKPMINSQTTDDELWEIFSQMIAVFDDEHTSILDPMSGIHFTSGAERLADAKASFSKNVTRTQYLEYYKEVKNAPDMSYGKINYKDIGYIYLGDTDGNDPEKIMDDILAEIGGHKAIIFDLRNNGGGFGEFATAMSNAFAQETELIVTVQTRNGLNYDDFDKETEIYNTDDNINQFDKPVIVLTDAFTISAAEAIVYALKFSNKVTHLGDRTAGAYSTVGNWQFLPNGWSYKHPIQISRSPNGELLDGEGFLPDVYSKNTPMNISNNNDLVISDAVQYLFDTYGIE